jgi:hypothetical protein
MARSIKKVKKPKTKKFWIILGSSIGVAIVGLIVGLFVWYALANTKTLVKRFTEYTSIKINANEFDDLIDPEKENNYKEAFVFIYDDSFVFDKPNAKEDSPEMKTYNLYVDAQTEFKRLYDLVQLANEGKEDLKTGIFLMNTSISTNSTMKGNDEFDSLTSPAIIGLYSGENGLVYKKTSEKVKGKDKSGNEAEYTISGGSDVEKFISVVQEIEDYVSNTYNVELK